MALLNWLERDFWQDLRQDAKLFGTINLEKISSNDMKSGLPDTMLSCQYGNFLIELKRIPAASLSSGICFPVELCTAQQLFFLERIWRINKSTFVFVGYKTTDHEKCIGIIPISKIREHFDINTPHSIKHRGEKWNFPEIIEMMMQLQ